MIAKQIKKDVLNLKPIDRIHLAELIFDSLNIPDTEIENEWVIESEKRYEAYKSGKIKGIPLAELRSQANK